MQTRVDPARDMIYVNGNRLPKKLPPKVYLALNKPKGCATVTCPWNYFDVPLLFNVLSQVWALNPMCICGLMRLQYHRYICSSGEKESKSVLCLFDDYLRSWVCVDWTSRIPFFWYVSFLQKASIPLPLNFSISLYKYHIFINLFAVMSFKSVMWYFAFPEQTKSWSTKTKNLYSGSPWCCHNWIDYCDQWWYAYCYSKVMDSCNIIKIWWMRVL